MAEEVKKLSETKSASGGEESKVEVKEESKKIPADAPKIEKKVEEVKAPEKTEKVAALEDPKAEGKPVSPVPNKPEGKEVKKPAPSGKYKKIIEQIESLSVLELSELVKELEDRFGVSASVPIAVAAAPAGDAAEETSEKATMTLHLADSGAQKIAVIKALREINPDLGLKEAKDLADGAPKDIKADMPREEAEEAKKKLEAAGAKVELK